MRERIVAAAARQLVILVGPEKLVPVLGSHGKLPVEVIPFGIAVCRRQLSDLNCIPQLRLDDGKPHITDNGNYILDCQVAPLERPAELEQAIAAIPGVVGSGLFLNMQPTILVQRGESAEVQQSS